MDYTSLVSILLISILIMSLKLFFYFENMNELLNPYFKKANTSKFFWIKSRSNLKITKVYMYAYDNLSEIELQALHKILKSESKNDNIGNIMVDYLIKIAFPFIIWFIGFTFILPTYLATYSQFANKSNFNKIQKALDETYTYLLDYFGTLSYIFIASLLFLMMSYNLMKKIIKYDINLRIGVIEIILGSKFKDSKLFSEEIRSNQMINEDWQLEYVKFLEIPIIISRIGDQSEHIGIIKGYSKESIILDTIPYNRKNYIIKVK